jgi:hypothetical protein
MPFDSDRLREVATDAENGNGCILADKLKDLNVNDRVNAMLMIDRQAKIDAGQSKNPNTLSLSRWDKYGHMQLFDKKASDWTSTSIYHEDFSMSKNASVVNCKDLHWEQSNITITNPFSKKFTNSY